MPSILLCHLISSLVLCCYAGEEVLTAEKEVLPTGEDIWNLVKEVWKYNIKYNAKIEELAQSILNRKCPFGPALVAVNEDTDFPKVSYLYAILADFGEVLKKSTIFKTAAVSELNVARSKIISSNLLTENGLRDKIIRENWQIGIINSKSSDGIKIVYVLANPDKINLTQFEFVIPSQPKSPEVTPNENPNTSRIDPDSNSYPPDVITTRNSELEVSPNPNPADVSTSSSSSSSTVDNIESTLLDETFTKSDAPDPTTLESSLNPPANDSQSDVFVTSDATNTPSNIQAEFPANSSTKLESLSEMEDSTNTPQPLKTPPNVPLPPAADPDIETMTKDDAVAVDSNKSKPGQSYVGALSPRSYKGLMLGVAATFGGRNL